MKGLKKHLALKVWEKNTPLLYKKAITKENAKLNNTYKGFSLSIFKETQNNDALKEVLLSHTKINESFQNLLTTFKQSNRVQNLESNAKDEERQLRLMIFFLKLALKIAKQIDS